MPLLSIALLLAASFALGALPLTRWAVRLLGGKDLRRLGTGNVGVSAAFIHGGKLAGIAAVLAEIARGILPVLAGRFWFPDSPAIAIALLIPLVAARYAIARGGGVTNAVWGLLVFSPPVAVSSGIWGLLVWGLARRLWQKGDRARLFASRCGCLCTPIWVWVWRQSLPEFLAAAGLGVLLAAINLSQGDDMALSKSEQLFSLDDSLDAKICGDKAARLSQLKRANFNVPSGWILLNESGIGHRASGIGHRASGIGHSENSENLSIPNSLIENLKSQIANRMIVRSSAAGEDGDISSAAGQYETIGPVSTEAELIAGIHRCRQSYWTSEAVSYRQQRQLPDTQMAVLIQPYIEGKVAGVMFSRNPLDGGSQIIIEALPGGAESVVGGQVTPLHLEVDFTQPEILQQTLNELEINSIVNPKLLAELVKQAQAIEAFFHGIPQDIEWSWDGEKVWILQSRPITNLQPFWTRTIAAEVIPGAIRPLTWSINRPLTCGVWGEIFRVVLADRAAHLNFNETATLLGSHAYFNATLLGEIFRMMGLPEQGLEFLLRGQKMGKPPLGKILPSLPGLWRLVQRERALNADFAGDRTSIFLPAIESLEKSEKEEGRRKREEGRGKNEEGILIPNAQFPIPNAQFPMPNAPCPMPHAQFPMPNYQDLSELLDKSEQIQKWLKPITYYNILGPIGLAIRKAIFRVDDDWLVNDTAPEIASVRALQELAEKLREVAIYQSGENVSAAQLAQIFTESLALQADFEQWLDIYGYLSEVGTDIAVPTWREQPETYRKLLVTMAQKSAVANSAATGKLSLTFAQKWRLNKCQERAIVKSQISEIYARLLAHLRWTFLAIEACGLEMQVFQEPGDIFYLEFGEIQQWIRSGASVSFQETISLRRDRLLADRDRPIPPVVYGNLLPNSQKRSIDSSTSATGIMQGIPASIGCVEGFVKICRSVTTELGENAIAVVPYTDAGWAPLLLGAKAIVAEVGGQLSHGAIIAREYKIPAVMNIAEATTRLRDGQKVRVDGYLGTVELLE
ncbi:MAG: glycerol-3-phosphate acyltransferase [Microcoleus sp. PH2017_39_LGB_O_B]|nr:glycerol-3-phosphate acyltransferase [Microcoleus sp. PH2017_09_SFU_O_A]MCC3565705.1 glycerol-3-phosphate acyltransferase [Microcoleus sp. PH2017_31_RDM_U_A]MCC3577517.1 glycerol-3-phosphate acyltransferase [Microcoleus sp. PH2017_32_RDM_D_A]MCC3615446.1 glycerol-3-phosphate acyltransferase [Microcoleus sp. PH2017_38_RDM_U_B]MCC3628937.1 glycerol-3-phosphate acyltransferase [Microcoleus sp. PH2017_39_LGB_O_B]MCC3641019.1 glycerol-3-phosphate acyltransferase [Microcoleus sp. PH2017_33_LGB_O_